MRIVPLILPFAAFLLVAAPDGTGAFSKDGCAVGECRDCHSLTRQEATALLGNLVDNVLSVEQSPVKGLWVIDVAKNGKAWPVYMDYAKEFVIAGQVVRLRTGENYSGERFQKLNRIDVSQIPLDDAIVIGRAEAKHRIVVFDNPDCPHCVRLHQEIKKVVALDPDVAFFIKILPGSNPRTVEKAKAIVCSRSAKILEDAFAGKALPPAPKECRTDVLAETVRLADRLNIRGTPTLVMPDGLIAGGYRTAEAILDLLRESLTALAEGQ
jgi:thiol:disulfide interchange protein DsbC